MPDGSVPVASLLLHNSDAGLRACPPQPLTADNLLLSYCDGIHGLLDKMNAVLSDGAEDDIKVGALADRLSKQIDQHTRQIATTPATTAEGLVAKARAAIRLSDETLLRSLAIDLIGRPPVPKVDATLTPDPLCSRDELLDRYNHWLYEERKMLCIERWGLENLKHTIHFVPEDRHARDAHYRPPQGSWRDAPPPSTRAAAVMAAGGVCLLPDNTLSPSDIARQLSYIQESAQ